MKKYLIPSNQDGLVIRWQGVRAFSRVVAGSLLLSCSTAFSLESHFDLGSHSSYTRDNPPPSGYWYSDVPGSYNPWTDDIQETLLQFPAINDGVTNYRDIVIEPTGWDMWWYNRVDGPQPAGAWEFVDLGMFNHLLTGNNWVYGNNYQYPQNTWALQISDEGSFDSWRLPDAGYDLRAYRGIAIEVSNLGDTYLILDSDMNKWLGKGHHAVIGLEPGETDILYHPFRRGSANVPQEIIDKFGGEHALVGYPGGHLYESVYSGMGDAEGPWKISAKVPPGVKKGNVKWSINKMWAGGLYELPSSAEISDSNYGIKNADPDLGEIDYTDEYGQWRHDDWVGKLWNQQDAINQYSELLQYVANNPGPSEWNQYGGWETGPQLEATGWFRVEKYNGRWWFVDPEGKLFLSQGSLHMSANTPKPAAQAGYTDETYPDAIYFPRLRTMGVNTTGGNSSWKWHEGKFPYTYQIKTGLAPISEDDVVAKGGEAGFTAWMQTFLFHARRYAADPYCIGFIVDNELNISVGDTMSKDEVARIYFKAVREALNALSADVGRPPMIMIDPASDGGYWMAYYSDVLAMHRMDGYYPGTHIAKFNSLGNFGIDRPVGQFTFTMGNLDQGVAHYGLTMFLNQRNRAQGVTHFMRRAYAHRNNIAAHIYAYMKTKAKPMTEYRFMVNKSDTTDYWLADYLREMGTEMYYIHMGMDPGDPNEPRVIYGPTSLVEADDNTGAIRDTLLMIVKHDTFTLDAISANHVTLQNVPAGLTPLFTRVSDTLVTLKLEGNAASHFDRDDIADLTVIFSDGAFSGADASAITNATRNDLTVDFIGDPTELRFSAPAFTVSEDGAMATVTVERVGDDPVSVDYIVREGTATEQVDFETVNGTLQWSEIDDPTKSFEVPIINDGSQFEGDETILVTLSNPTNHAVVSGLNPVTLTIIDNDPVGGPGGMVSHSVLADAYVAGGSKDTNYGDNTTMFVKKGNSDKFTRQGYVRFEYYEGPIETAVLKLTPTALGTPSGLNLEVMLAPDDQDGWGEYTVTWNSKPTVTGDEVQRNAGSFTVGVPVELDVTALVNQGMEQNQKATFRLDADNSGGGYSATFAAREYLEPTYRPVLEITYAAREVSCQQASDIVGQTDLAGVRLYQAESELTTVGPVTVRSGASIRFEAGMWITLNPGFRVEPDSAFGANIKLLHCD